MGDKVYVCPVCMEYNPSGVKVCEEPKGPKRSGMSIDNMTPADCKEVMSNGTPGERLDAWAILCELWDIRESDDGYSNEYEL